MRDTLVTVLLSGCVSDESNALRGQMFADKPHNEIVLWIELLVIDGLGRCH